MTGKRSRSRPALQRALRHLQELVVLRRATGELRLPVIPELAAAASVAPVTMREAVGRFEAQGLLTVRKGLGIHVIPGQGRPAVDTVDSEETPLSRRWEEIAARLRLDIMEGTYAPGEQFPGAKQLAYDCGSCYRTIARALRTLEADGFLSRYRRGYRVRRGPTTPGSVRIGLVMPGMASGVFQPMATALLERMRALESICARSNVSLVPVTFYYIGTSIRFHGTGRGALRRAAADPSLVGFIVMSTGVARADNFGLLLERVAAAGRPVAVLDETGITSRLTPAPGSARTRVFVMACSRSGGRAAAHYLFGMGHRRIAYISPYHSTDWSQARLEGLREAAKAYGPAAEVRAFTGEYSPSISRTSSYGPQLRQMARSLLASALPAGWSQRHIMPFTVDRLADAIARTTVSEGLRPVVQPLFRQALQSPGVTAWVGANDAVASPALWFLQRSGRQVPSRMSVLGFDDSEEAFRQDLTSYNWNGTGVMAAMVSYILDWRMSQKPPAVSHPVEIEGFITSRTSVARRRT